MYCKLAISLLFATLLSSTLGAYVHPDFITDSGKAITKLIGLNCISEFVLNLEDSAGDFQYNAQKCGNATRDSVASVLDDIEGLTRITENVLNINDKDCNNGGYKDSEDSTKNTPAACIPNMTRQMTKLDTSIEATWNDIDALEQLAAPDNVDACAKIALVTFRLALENIPTFATTCASFVV